jgi:hypothetical protein
MAEPAERAAEDSRPVEPMVSLAEAAAMTGRPAEAIRAMIRRGKLKALKGNDGRTLVAIPAELIQPSGQPRHSQVNGQDGRVATPAEAEDSRVAAIATAVEEWRAAAEEARLAAAVAEVKLAEAERVRAAEVAEVRAKAEAAERVIAELRAMLAEARRPFWRRWWG